MLNDRNYFILKVLACVTMLIDHAGYFFRKQWDIPTEIYLTTNLIGRLAFPLFAFLLVESYYHTKHKIKHGLRILLLAIISEFPFNLLHTHGYLFDEIQNVCFTLFVGYAMLFALDAPFVKKKYSPKYKPMLVLIEAMQKFYPIYCFSIACIVTVLINSDYSFKGITLIAIFNLAHNAKPFKCGKKVFDIEISRNLFIALAIGVFAGLMYHSPLYYICYLLIIALCLATSKLCNKTNEKIEVPKGVNFILRNFYPLHIIFLIAFRFVLSL